MSPKILIISFILAERGGRRDRHEMAEGGSGIGRVWDQDREALTSGGFHPAPSGIERGALSPKPVGVEGLYLCGSEKKAQILNY